MTSMGGANGDGVLFKYALAIGIDELSTNTSFSISPNPFTNELTVTCSNNKGTGSKKQMSLFDYTGKEILHRETSAEEIHLNTENLAAGFYLLRVGGENFKVVKGN